MEWEQVAVHMNETVTVRFTWGATTSDVASREGNWDLIFDFADWALFWTSFAVTTTPNWLTTRLGFVCSVLSNAGLIMRSSDCSCPTCKRFCRLFLCSLGNILYTELVPVDEFAQFQCLMVTLLPPYIMSSRAFAQGENRREKNPSLSMCQSRHLQIVNMAINNGPLWMRPVKDSGKNIYIKRYCINHWNSVTESETLFGSGKITTGKNNFSEFSLFTCHSKTCLQD